MFYKNYMFNYKDICEIQDIIVLNRDMTNFKNETREDGEFILAHTKGIIEIPTKEFENPYDYLKGGLFKGIIPPELILQSIDEWRDIQNKGLEEAKKNMLEISSKKLSEDFFIELYNSKGCTLNLVLYYLNSFNEIRMENNLEPFDIEKEYKDYLIKYWGDFKVDE